MAFGPHRARRTTYKSAEQAYAKGYQVVYGLMVGVNNVAEYIERVEEQCERAKSNTLVPFLHDYWRGQVDHLREIAANA